MNNSRLPLCIGMTAAPRPQRTIESSISQLRYAGFSQTVHVFEEPGTDAPTEPGVFVTTNSRRLGAWKNWLSTAHSLLENTSDPFLLICQDDFRMADFAAGALQQVMEAQTRDDWGYASLHTAPHISTNGRSASGWQALNGDTATQRALACCFTRESLRAVLQSDMVRNHQGDRTIGRIVSQSVQALNRKRYVHLPSLCEHTGEGISTSGALLRTGLSVPTVSVIVTCHNYGRYLETAILSVLRQTRPVDEILVVDDASSDNTRQITEQFAEEGVRYLRVEHRNVQPTRRDGFGQTRGDIVLFLDADNYLSRQYIEHGLEEFTHRNIGVVYPDLERFGTNGTGRTSFPDYSRGRLMRENFVDMGALIRREALELGDVFTTWGNDFVTFEDYILFQKLARDGWEFRKQQSALMYRMHAEQKTYRSQTARAEAGYFITHGLQNQEVTLFIPLSGRDEAWKQQSRFLQQQVWPHDRLRLIFCDTTQRPEFSHRVRQWISDCDYADIRHFTARVARPGLADDNRYDPRVEREVQIAMCRIYNRLRAALETDYCWILEDDIIPPVDALERLLRCFGPDVGSVCAPYSSRWDRMHVVWDVDANPEQGTQMRRAHKPAPHEPQVTEVCGSGFGCLVVRSELILDHVFALPRRETYYDPYFFRTLDDRWRLLCDWTCECEHLGLRGFAAMPETST